MSILNHWPDPDKKPRDIQIQALEWLEKQTAKYLVLELPVGAGKSLLGVTYSRFLAQGAGDAFILTPQRILQKQYETDFSSIEGVRLFSLYGQSNYQCHSKKTNCQTGKLIKPKCPNCSHSAAKEKAKQSSNLVLNYELGLLQFTAVKDFGQRQLLVCDEAHGLESTLCEFDAIHISRTRMEQVRVKWQLLTKLKDAYEWTINTYLPALSSTVDSMKRQVEPLLESKSLSPDEIALIREYMELAEHFNDVNELTFITFDDLQRDWVLVHDKLNIKFKRLRATEIFQKYLGTQADRCLLMSATIPNPTEFCKDLGIPTEDFAFLSLASDFPKENRKVVAIPHMKMNVDWDKPQNKQGRRDMLDGIEMVCNLHKEQKGIIHTANFVISEWVVDNLKIDQQIFHHNPESGEDRNSVIKAFMECNKPAVLVSPSITEGLDLKQDLGRFGIVVKTPYPYLGDQWVKAKMDISVEWYQRQAIVQVLQGCGRIVRSKDDYGTTYILDGSWPYLYKQMYSYIPKWWHQAYTKLE